MQSSEILLANPELLSPVQRLGQAFAFIGRAIHIKQVGGRRYDAELQKLRFRYSPSKSEHRVKIEARWAKRAAEKR